MERVNYNMDFKCINLNKYPLDCLVMDYVLSRITDEYQ